MKLKLSLPLACLVLVAAAAGAREPASALQNRAATRDHYNRLLAGPAPRLAELTLFTTLLPKGGDLHHHYSGAIYAETYLDWVAAQGMCIYRVTDAALKIEKFRIESDPQGITPAVREHCISADAARSDDGFYRGLLQRWSDKDFDNHVHEQPPPDKQFFDTFGYFGPASGYDNRVGLRHLKARALAENVGYLETMLRGGPAIDRVDLLAPLQPLNAASSDAQVMSALEAATALIAADAQTEAMIAAYVQSLADAVAGIDDTDFRLRLQTYTSRNNPPPRVFGALYTSFAAAARSPHVVGVNFVGPENGVVAMRDYSLHMKFIAFLRHRFPGVRVALHAGELALGMVPPEGLRHHVREAVLVAGADRIGHGVDIAHETGAPELLEAMRRRQVAVEVNLSSNAFILGVRDEAHPLRLYARHRVPFVISTDDAGVSRNTLSGEYLLYVSRYRPSYDELRQTVVNSIRHAFLNDADRRDELARLERRLADFERRIAALPKPVPALVAARPGR
jgi:adenosine deaminase/adenosine deaminase CECR1